MMAGTLYKIGALSMMIMGGGHLVAHFALDENDPASKHIYMQMDTFKLSVMGFGSRSLLDFMDGFSIIMGVTVFFAGLQSFFLSGNLRSFSEHHRGIILLPALLAGIIFILSLKYLIILPQALSLLAFIGYSLSLWKLSMEKGQREVSTNEI